jgi:hypothetical protein
MQELIVSGAFMITIGHGDVPEVVMFLSTQNADGTPAQLQLPDPDDPDATWPIEVFTGISARFGTASIPCVVVEVESVLTPPPGFVGLTLETRNVDEVGRLADMGVTAFGVIADTGAARGQGVIASADAAHPQSSSPQ